jgi:hypothetical protein
MIRSSLVKAACVAIVLSGFSPPPAGAIEMQGANPSAPIVAAPIGAAAFIAAATATTAGASTAAGTAAGRDRAGIDGVRAERSRPALRSAFWPPARPSPTRASRQRRDCAGITPIQATARASGTPAKATRLSFNG